MPDASAILDFKDLIVWQRAMEFGKLVYHLSSSFPSEERFGLTSQVRRAAVSVVSNIAEGHARQGRGYAYFLSVAKGSTAEVESQLMFAAELGYLSQADIEKARAIASEVHRMLSTILRKLADKTPSSG